MGGQRVENSWCFAQSAGEVNQPSDACAVSEPVNPLVCIHGTHRHHDKGLRFHLTLHARSQPWHFVQLQASKFKKLQAALEGKIPGDHALRRADEEGKRLHVVADLGFVGPKICTILTEKEVFFKKKEYKITNIKLDMNLNIYFE